MIVRGTVVSGLGIAGALFGVPTANLKLEEPMDLPPGVYLGRTSFGGTAYPSVICYGADGGDKFEVHLLNAKLDLLHETLSVEVGDKVNDLVNEPNQRLLNAKVLADVEKAKTMLGIR